MDGSDSTKGTIGLLPQPFWSLSLGIGVPYFPYALVAVPLFLTEMMSFAVASYVLEA